MLWVIGIIIALAIVGHFIPKAKKPFQLNSDGMPVCPECEVFMDWGKNDRSARCHDCHQVFPAPSDLWETHTSLRIRSLEKQVRQLELAAFEAKHPEAIPKGKEHASTKETFLPTTPVDVWENRHT